MQDALKAALLLSVAHMLVTGADLPASWMERMFMLSLAVTGAVVICNAVAASQDDEDDAKQILESVACVIAFCVFLYAATHYQLGHKLANPGTNMGTISFKDWTETKGSTFSPSATRVGVGCELTVRLCKRHPRHFMASSLPCLLLK